MLTNDQIDAAYESFVSTRDTSDDSELQAEFDFMKEQIKLEQQNPTSFKDMFVQPGLRKRCIIGWLTMFGAQGTGTLVINSKFILDAEKASS